ncbi:MAG: class II aldolase/adducin family protein [Gemmatimonadota bacterium]
MRFVVHGLDDVPSLESFAARLRRTMASEGHHEVSDADDADLVLHFFPADAPRSFRREHRSVFVAGVTRMESEVEDPLRQGYRLLIRSISNLLVMASPDGLDGSPDAAGSEGDGASASGKAADAGDGREPTRLHFLTPEQGHYRVDRTGNGEGFYRAVLDRIEPLASSTLVIENEFVPDLPEELRDGDEVTASITRAGERLGKLDLLPSPTALEEILPRQDLRHLKRMFGIGGMSYGNVSARKDEERFWMSASGVDKSSLREIGTEILLVTGYDAERNAMVLSVPPDVEPSRVSVDAIEHWMIYQEHPEVGAILHVHAWMEGVESTDVNYPCGTYELGEAVAEIVRQAPDPSRAVVGLKNHGLTITGRSLDGIFERVEGRLLREVPMS